MRTPPFPTIEAEPSDDRPYRWRRSQPGRGSFRLLRWLAALAALAATAALPGIGQTNASYSDQTSSGASFGLESLDGLLSQSVWWLDSTDSSTLFTDTGCSTPASGAGATVNCWVDKADNTNKIVSFAPTGAGTISPQTVAGKQVVHFGYNGDMRGPDRLGGQAGDMTMFVVTKALASTANFLVSLNGTSTSNGDRFTAHLPYSTGNSYFDAGGCCTTNRSVTNGVPINTTLVFQGWKDTAGGHSYHRVNSFAQAQSPGNTTTSTAGGMRVGVHADHLIGEIIVFNRLLSQGERDWIFAYLKAKWGVA